MKDVRLIGYHITKFNFDTHLTKPTQLQLKHQFGYNVAYDNRNTCQGELRVTIDGGKELKLEAVVVGLFETEPGLPKESIHLKSYDELFPYAKVLISSITSTMGLPPIQIPYVDISNQSIIHMEVPRPASTDEVE